MSSRRGPDNSVRFSVGGTINSVAWANVFYAQLTTSGTIAQADLDTWLTNAAAAYKTAFQSLQGTTATYQQARAVLFAPGGGQLSSIATMTGTGGGGTAVADDSAAAVISWTTSVYWRGGKPRSYLSGVPNTAITTGHFLSGTYQGNVATGGGNFRTAINALTAGTITGSTLGFVSFRSGNADRGTPLFFAHTGARCHPRLGTQRRRLGKWAP